MLKFKEWKYFLLKITNNTYDVMKKIQKSRNCEKYKKVEIMKKNIKRDWNISAR